ncbi:MAG TPA: DoxX family protein [Vicinamibacterales bacterium]|nr:DoxX family protein [Vicinamibacterales bacterium]
MPSAPDLKFVVEERRGPIDVFTLWLPRVALVLAFLIIGGTKFNDNPHGDWFKIFERIGWGQWFRYFTGAMQIAGALLMLTRWTLTIGAALLACTMVGAVIVDIVVMHAIGYALAPLVLLGMVTAVWYAGRFGARSGPSGDFSR